jgi:hypothetical protein
MADSTPNMSLTRWNLDTDPFNHTELAVNWQLVDVHDHTTGKGVPIPEGGLAANSVATINLKPASVTTDKIQDGAITYAKLEPGTVPYSKLNTLNTGQIVVGNAGTPQAVTMGGDATVDENGIVTVSAGAISRAELVATSFQTVRVTTGSIASSGSANVTAALGVTMANTSYTAVATVEETTDEANLVVKKILSRSTTQVVLRVVNEGASARTGTVHLWVIKD